jgi:hypothetical protein
MKIDAVVGEIEPLLLFIPREHGYSVGTSCRYGKMDPPPRSCRLSTKQADRRAALLLAKLTPRAGPFG